MLESQTQSSTATSATPDHPRNDAPERFVDECVHQRMKRCPYSHFYNRVSWRFAEGKLILSGIVPSFYIKQVLQMLLKNIPYVGQLENQVDVVSATGLSSVRSSRPR
jgi:hypothetical protein